SAARANVDGDRNAAALASLPGPDQAAARRIREIRRRALGAPVDGGAPGRQISGRRRRMVDQVHGSTAVSSQIGFMPAIAWADIRADLPKIKCPTLVLTTDENGHNSIEATRAWQQVIPNSTL